ncbi:MAG TPA: malic enzyme-like NAD(P)-binding protein, partial [Noviherbaspirillum sp.]
MTKLEQQALDYHAGGQQGKIAIHVTKPVANQGDLALAYSPGVAVPCVEINKDPARAYDYTAKGNLVGVITNGTAVLGLGDIGALAGKPVMEGKAVLFKKFAGIDAFDIEIDETNPEKLVEIVAALHPTFGGINLEDIKAPECFYVERTLRDRLSIPVFHDDQHGTAIVVGAGFLNAIALTGRDISLVKVVCSGAGAAALACLDMMASLGVQRSNVLVVDSKGVLHDGRRDGVDPSKQPWCRTTDARTLADAVRDADVFLGCS